MNHWKRTLFFLPLVAGLLTPTSAQEPPSWASEYATFRERILLRSVNHQLAFSLPQLQACHRRTRRSDVGALATRLERILVSDDATVGACRDTLAADLRDVQAFAQSQRAVSSMSQGETYFTQDLLELLRLAGQIEPLRESVCARELGKATENLRRSERRLFRNVRRAASVACGTVGGLAPVALRACFARVSELFDGLDPHCTRPVDHDFRPPGMIRPLETNPCFAGNAYVARAMTADGKLLASETTQALQGYANLIWQAVAQAEQTGTRNVDLEAVFRASPLAQAGLGTPRMMLASLAYLQAAAKSPSGYVDDFGTDAWRETIEQGGTAEAALANYNARKRALDYFRDTREYAKKKGIGFTLGSTSVEGFNRHQYISAFLSCHYRARGQAGFARSIPALVGRAYESKDFVSHLRVGASLRESRENYRTDTARYREGAEIGFRLCPPETVSR